MGGSTATTERMCFRGRLAHEEQSTTKSSSVTGHESMPNLRWIYPRRHKAHVMNPAAGDGRQRNRMGCESATHFHYSGTHASALRNSPHCFAAQTQSTRTVTAIEYWNGSD